MRHDNHLHKEKAEVLTEDENNGQAEIEVDCPKCNREFGPEHTTHNTHVHPSDDAGSRQGPGDKGRGSVQGPGDKGRGGVQGSGDKGRGGVQGPLKPPFAGGNCRQVMHI